MIEEGYCNDGISHAIVHNYLEQKELQGIDALILACTHYVIIKPEINAFYHGKIKLFDSTGIVATKLKAILAKEGLLSDAKTPGRHSFYVSDYTFSFQQTTRIFFGESIQLEACNIWL